MNRSGDLSEGPVELRFLGSARERVGRRTRELAVLAGRVPPYVSQLDYEQAKRDVTGESLLERQESFLDAAEREPRRAAGALGPG